MYDGRHKRQRIGIVVALAIVMVLILIFGKNERVAEPGGSMAQENPVDVPPPSSSGAAVVNSPDTTEEPEDPADGVFSFLQGPKSYEQQLDWSGSWGKEIMDGSSFGAFGCGFCAMANIYSTLTEYYCLPPDLYNRSKKVTMYGGGGAVSWGLMRQTMADIGFTVQLGEKPATYSGFKEVMENSPAVLVLVSSYNSDVYWKNTPGHYVTLFLYDAEKEDAFLTDSGDPTHNRQRVPLKMIYKSLKTSSDFQYMSVVSYDKNKDNWKRKSLKGNWVMPKTLSDYEK